jgi:hypothetical protein
MTGATARLFIAVDEDDAQIPSYHKLLFDAPDFVSWLRCPTHTMVEALNYVAQRAVGKHDVIGFMGDDHRPRTPGWDHVMSERMSVSGPAVLYGNDLIQGPNLPTHVFLPSAFIHQAGHMAPETLTHLYVDNYWRELGTRTSTLTYVPEIVIEHMHPIAGKTEWDEGYRRVNDGSLYAADSAAFNEFVAAGRMDRDVAILKHLVERWSVS